MIIYYDKFQYLKTTIITKVETILYNNWVKIVVIKIIYKKKIFF